MKMDKLIENVINEVLKEHDQPYVEEFKTFIEHILSENVTNEELLERIIAINIKEE